MISPVDCALEHLINRGQNCNVDVADKRTTALVLFNSKLGLHTWKISAVVNATVRDKANKTNKQTNKQTRKVTYGDVTGWLYWSIHELTVILPPRTMYDWWNKRGGRPHHLGNISYSFSTIVPVSCFTTLYQTSPKFVNIHEFREGISVKFRSIYCRRNFAQWDEMGRKFGSKRRVSTIRPLLMNY